MNTIRTNRNVKAQMVLEVTPDTAVIARGNTTVEFNAGGGVVVYTNGDVRVRPAVNDDVKPRAGEAPQIGDRMEDGTIYAGISPDTNKPMYALPVDAPLTMKWKQAMDFAAKLEGNGHPKGTFRVPTSGELNVLFQNRAKIGGFNEIVSHPAWWYWSSTESCVYADYAWVQRFFDGYRDCYSKSYESSLRLVRS